MTDEEGVLGNLPKSRPGKRSAKRSTAAKRSAKASTPAAKPGRQADVEVGPVYGAQAQRESARGSADPLNAAARTAAGLAVTGVRVAGAVTQELLRRLPRP
jgi:hypothetical protein